MKVRVDLTLCQGHGVCMGEAPEVFRIREDGTLEVLRERPADQLREKVENAVKYCPTRAITLQPGD